MNSPLQLISPEEKLGNFDAKFVAEQEYKNAKDPKNKSYSKLKLDVEILKEKADEIADINNAIKIRDDLIDDLMMRLTILEGAYCALERRWRMMSIQSGVTSPSKPTADPLSTL